MAKKKEEQKEKLNPGTTEEKQTEKEPVSDTNVKKEPVNDMNVEKEPAAVTEGEELLELVEALPGEVILDVNPPEDDKIPLDPESGIDPEKLESELSDLKDLVQNEIDKMMEESPDKDWKDIVKEARDAKFARKTSIGKLCECCGENEVDEDETYCESCLETMKHYPFDWWKFISPVITVILLVLCFSFFAISLPVYKETAEAQKLVKSGKLQSALTAYDKINAEIKVTDENFGSRYLLYQLRLYDKIGIDEYEALSKFIEKYYVGTSIDKWYNKEAKGISDKVTSYKNLYKCVNKAMQVATDYDSFTDLYEKEIKGENFNEAQVLYYKYYAAVTYGESSEKKMEILNKIKEVDPNFKSLYLPLMGEVALADRDYDAMIKYSAEIRDFNCETPYAYWYKIVAYRLQGNIPKAAAACNEALEVLPQDGLINYQMAVICLLQGQNKTAKTYAETAYNNASTASGFLSSASLYYLCCGLTDDSETSKAISENLTNYGYGLAQEVEKILDGSMTVEDVFVNGEGDFTWG